MNRSRICNESLTETTRKDTKTTFPNTNALGNPTQGDILSTITVSKSINDREKRRKRKGRRLGEKFPVKKFWFVFSSICSVPINGRINRGRFFVTKTYLI